MEKLDKYILTNEERELIKLKIIDDYCKDIEASNNPKAYIHLGAPGSGKTVLNNLAKASLNGNIVDINNDNLKKYHPNAVEISKLYPDEYIKFTSKKYSNYWTDSLIDNCIINKLNLIFEGTGRNYVLIREIIEKMKNYNITCKFLAVDELTCLYSILKRYRNQINKYGNGRIVSVETFYKSYCNEMLDTAFRLSNLNEINNVEVYIRNNYKPKRIYSSVENNGIYSNIIDAILEGRKIDKENTLKESNKIIEKISYHDILNEELEIIEKIKILIK